VIIEMQNYDHKTLIPNEGINRNDK
jgi:hypothetical protein